MSAAGAPHRIDLNAKREARAAEREAKGIEIVVAIGEDEFTLPPELPVEVVDSLAAEGNASKAIKLLLGEVEGRKFLTYKPSIEDVAAMLEAYGHDLGEALASIA